MRARPPAGLVQRAIARSIDVILAGIVVIAMDFFYLVMLGVEGAENTEGATNHLVLGSVGSGVMIFGYFVFFETLRGRTPGKKLVGFRVQGPGGARKPNLKQSVIRNSFLLLMAIPFLGVALMVAASIFIAVTINNSPTKQGRHDELAGGTQVIED
ncbi:RDD family protein [Mycobacterium heidelbergense]|uniref:RDD family protein n=1 Tax=Mycobacterium heidelbergense TaxID=53376 RepID=UPI003CF20873